MTPWFWVRSSFIQTTHPLNENWQSFSLKRNKYTVPVALSWKQIAVHAADPFLSLFFLFIFLSVLLLKKVLLQRWAEPEENSLCASVCAGGFVCVFFCEDTGVQVYKCATAAAVPTNWRLFLWIAPFRVRHEGNKFAQKHFLLWGAPAGWLTGWLLAGWLVYVCQSGYSRW